MRLMTIALLLTACAGVDAATIADVTGTWSIDTEATWAEWQKRPEFAEASDEMKDAIKEAALTMMGTMTLEVTGDSFTRSDNGTVVGTTPFTVTASEGDTLIIENAAANGEKQAGRFELRDDKLAMSDGANGVLVFKRGAPESPAATPTK